MQYNLEINFAWAGLFLFLDFFHYERRGFLDGTTRDVDDFPTVLLIHLQRPIHLFGYFAEFAIARRLGAKFSDAF